MNVTSQLGNEADGISARENSFDTVAADGRNGYQPDYGKGEGGKPGTFAMGDGPDAMAGWISGAQWADELDVSSDEPIAKVLGTEAWKAVRKFCRKFGIPVEFYGGEGMAFADFDALPREVWRGTKPAVEVNRRQVAEFTDDIGGTNPHEVGRRLTRERAQRFRERDRIEGVLKREGLSANTLYSLDAVESLPDGERLAAEVRAVVDRENRRAWNTPKPNHHTERTYLATAGELHKLGAKVDELKKLPKANSTDLDDALEILVVERHRYQLEVRRRGAIDNTSVIALPQVMSLEDLLATEDESKVLRINRVWPAGGAKVMCAAKAGHGKTTLSGNLIRSLADGVPFLGAFEINQTAQRMVIIDNEMTAGMLKSWLRAQGIVNTSAVVDVVTLRGQAGMFDMGSDQVRDMWTRRLADLGCDFLFFDCVKPVLEAMGLDENHDMGKLLYPMHEMLTAAGVPDVLVHHHMGHTAEHARGDSSALGWTDANWEIVPGNAKGTEHMRFFRAPKVRDADGPLSEGLLSFDPVTKHLTYAGGTRAQAKDSDLVEERLAAIQRVLADAYAEGTEELTATALQKAVGGKKDITDKARELGEKRELITLRRQGLAKLYRLNPDAPDPLTVG